MAESKYFTAPTDTTRMPPGIPYIVGNEAAERFSFYGMKAILTVFMTKYLLGFDGELDTMSEPSAKFWVHTFVAAAYFFPLFGAIVSDWLWGKYRTILALSVIYCLGHLSLALDESRLGLGIGLALIAIGTGAIKPCVSAHVGDQFGKPNQHLLSKVFGWFYIAINMGAAASSLLTPILLDKKRFYELAPDWFTQTFPWITPGPSLAFGIPGILMALATVVFWMGRNRFIHIPPRGKEFFKESFSGEGLSAIKRLVPIYAFVAVFWCLFDQTASAWVLQADSMELNWLGITWLSSQLQAVNPVCILILVPTFSYVIYPAVNRVFPLTPLRKMSLGMFLTIAAFSVSAWIQMRIDGGAKPSIGWQVVAYVLLTAAEVMISITCLEFSYTQAPNSIKSLIMSLYLLSVAAGNEFTAVVNWAIERPDGSSRLPGADYYWFFTAIMAVAAVGFVFVARSYRGETYIQESDSDRTSQEKFAAILESCPECGVAVSTGVDQCAACGATISGPG